LKILAIDTSGEQAGAAILKSPYITVGEIFLNARTGEKSWTHSEILMPGVERLFELTRIEPTEIDFVAYTNGPGSFTGLRIGAASALGIARALNIPAICVPTLDALAYNVFMAGGECIIVPMLNARRGQVYTASYMRSESGLIEKISDYSAMAIEEISSIARHKNLQIIFLGDGADANIEFLHKNFPDAIFAALNNNRQRAASAGVCAMQKLSSGEAIEKNPEILYIRAPQAVREMEAKKCAL